MGRSVSLVAVLLAFVAPAAGGCGATDDVRGPAAVSAAADQVYGRFVELPRYPRSEPTGPATSSSSGLTRAFRAADASADTVLEFYVDALVGWTVVEAPRPDDAGALRARWSDGAYRLTITAADVGGGVAEFRVVLSKP